MALSGLPVPAKHADPLRQHAGAPNVRPVPVDGQDLTSLSESELTRARRQIGMIFQHFNLLSSRTVFGNVALPLELDNTPRAEIKSA